MLFISRDAYSDFIAEMSCLSSWGSCADNMRCVAEGGLRKNVCAQQSTKLPDTAASGQ